MTKMNRWIPLLLAAEFSLVACNSGGGSAPDAGQDGGQDAGQDAGAELCTTTVTALQQLANEVEACDPDAGFPPDTETASEVAHCLAQIEGCDSQDLSTLNTSATCLERLPPIQCKWLHAGDAGLPLAALAWGFEAYGCEPAPPLSKSCNVTLPFDGGLPPF